MRAGHSIIKRRTVLGAFAAAAAVTTLSACSSGSSTGASDSDTPQSDSSRKGSVTDPMKVPSTLKESPALTALVDAGRLPALAKRIPASPYVVPHRWLDTGTYGGTLKMSINDTANTGMYEYFYGYSFVRYLNDGLDIGPGLAESWEVDKDSTTFTFHFRKGLRWSDGKPWTTADVLYWWKDLVGNPDYPMSPPDDVRDGRDQIAEITAVDDTTLRLSFKNPAPAAVERIAAWVNGTGQNGAAWTVPKHYLSQFHPQYNKAIDPDSDWQTAHDRKLRWLSNPDCPTLAGWHCETYREGRSVVLARNPYYYAVTPGGDQLPYIDRIQWLCTQDPQVQLLQFTTSKVDYVHGGHTALTLADFSSLKKAEASGRGLKVRTWDSGSGTGSVTFLNFDIKDAKWRALVAKQKMRLAMSHAFNRPDVRKTIYFETGELTTGTLSTKGPLFNSTETGKQMYAKWRDASSQYDPAKAKALLDELGVVDADGDGLREYPDGSRLRIRIDYPADTSNEHLGKCRSLARDWKAVGLDSVINPVTPTAFDDQWARGELTMLTAWESSDSNVLVYPNFVVPVATSSWAPLHGQGYTMRISDPAKIKSQAGLDPWKRKPPHLTPDDETPMTETITRLQDIYDLARVEADPAKRAQHIWDIIKIHVEEGPLFLGVVCNYPQPVLTHADLSNVPQPEELALGGWVNPWVTPSPAVYDPEAYFWRNVENHQT
jgi:peptide/nickel transport system substrate-binding protein